MKFSRIKNAKRGKSIKKPLSSVFRCPNINCDNVSILKEGETCPKCGTLAKNVTFGEIVNISRDKIKRRSENEKEEFLRSWTELTKQ